MEAGCLEGWQQCSYGPSGDAYVVALKCCPNKAMFASVVGRGSGFIEVLDLPECRAVHRVEGPHSGKAPSDLAAFQQDPAALASCGDDGAIKLWDVRAKGGAPRVLHKSKDPTNAVTVSGDDRFCAFGDGLSVQVFDLTAGKVLFTHDDAHTEPVSCLRFNPHRAQELISASEDGLLCALDTEQCASGTSAKEQHGLRLVVNTNEDIRSFDLVGDTSSIVATVSATETLQLWSFSDRRGGSSCGRFEGLRADSRLCVGETEGYVVGVAYDETSGRAQALAGAVDGTLAFFHLNMEGAVCQGVLPRPAAKKKKKGGHVGIVRTAVQFDRTRGWDGGFATGGEDGRILIWRPTSAGASAAGPTSAGASENHEKRHCGGSREAKRAANENW